MTLTSIKLIGAAMFAVAILHTSVSKFFEHLAYSQPTHAKVWHLHTLATRAVTGSVSTIIANAPNLADITILRDMT